MKSVSFQTVPWFLIVFLHVMSVLIVAFTAGAATTTCRPALGVFRRQPLATAKLTATYPGIPESLRLDKVVVIHRHGDRAQISSGIGGPHSPYRQANDDVRRYWESALPTASSLASMWRVARHGVLLRPQEGVYSEVVEEDTLYSGWDQANRPYAQLTERGFQQLRAVGQTLRNRYHATNILPTQLAGSKEKLYCRTTNICRTIQSLRSLLVGLFEQDLQSTFDATHNDNSYIITDNNCKLCHHNLNVPMIYTRNRPTENLLPQVDGEAVALGSRRAAIFPQELMAQSTTNYASFEQRMFDLFQFEDRVNWMTIKEILTCHKVHGVKQLAGITDNDELVATEIAGWIWGVIYKV
jgi:hypothetical protein